MITGKTPTIFAICVLSCVKDPAHHTYVINVCYLCTFSALLYMFQTIMMIISVVVVVIDDDDILNTLYDKC